MTMKSKTTLLLLILVGCVINFKLTAQNRSRSTAVSDTLFVYDTIYVTDTLKVYRPDPLFVLPAKSLQRELSKQNQQNTTLLIISNDFAATISGINIIDSSNILHLKNMDSMKKMNFFGVMLFAVQHMVLAQNNFSVQLGSGIFQNVASTGVSSKAAPTITGGLHYSRDFAHEKLRFTTGLEYRCLLRSDFGNQSTIDFPETTFYANEKFDYAYHMFSLPVAVQWNSKWISPFVGVEGYYKKSPKISFESVNSSTGSTDKLTNIYSQTGWGVFGGVSLPFSKRAGLDIKYFQGLTKENSESIARDSYYTLPVRLDVGIRYKLR